jgi:hypothetical protein
MGKKINVYKINVVKSQSTWNILTQTVIVNGFKWNECDDVSSIHRVNTGFVLAHGREISRPV